MQRTGPGFGVRDFFGNDVNDATHSIGAVKRGHRAADDLDALNGLQRRQPALFNTRVVAVWAGASRTDAFAVHQEQGVLRGHAANTDITATSTAGDDDARDISQGIGNITVGFIFNLLF